MRLNDILKMGICVVLLLIIGTLPQLIGSHGSDMWYESLTKPYFHPPRYIFGPVWILLYALMGISLYLVLKAEPGPTRKWALSLFALQLFLNFLWGILFFVFRQPEWAMMEIISNWFCIVWMITTFLQIKPTAAYLQIPYLLWVTFAAILNSAIWLLN